MTALLITASDLCRLPQVTLLDVRWALGDPAGREHYRAGHVPGALFADLDTELASPGTVADGRHPLPALADLQETVRRWGVRIGKPVVAYDNTGGLAAARAWWLLRWAGVEDVRLLDGGLGAWIAAGYDVESGENPAPGGGDVPLRPGQLPVLDADEAAALAGSGVLLDARPGERYRGEVEPVDSRPGHIPGAVSAPTAGNLRPDGTFRPADELRELFAGKGVTGSAPVGVYCGSGVTAAHEVAALAIAGIEASLYPGSWSQWSADPSRPAVTGPWPTDDEPGAPAD
ncbi:sulfurtransferase [Cryptosporangium phraense]|uniref:Sulfurtransferase n=1 Tax=Cryptosporangium phraense TaxID=2593070 RepID=A0A545AZM7_9ACTN|nr:sulfurtransferase [Cryptosporangium phraense]TQS46786.1 sulfurtransferase [Cryptosporangium phraense]